MRLKFGQPPGMPDDEWARYRLFLVQQEQKRRDRFTRSLQANPPLPPWLAFPGIDREDMFWRMGEGEDHIASIGIYLEYCSESERVAWRASYPEPVDWKGWHATD